MITVCNDFQVKPCINQVNLTTCCVIPQEMKDFAAENDIQLLTHNDPDGKHFHITVTLCNFVVFTFHI